MGKSKSSKKTTNNHYIISACFGVLILILTILNITSFALSKPSVYTEESVEESKKFWQQIVQSHPSYKDGYLALARIYIEEDNIEASKVLIEKARQVSPNEDVILPSLRQ